ncbi:hypothetical protein ACFQ0X_29655 [Streptomyces rectiviolaceus]|uniref:Lipoprotein n=1 Tax=Streptomyces rectiviolaceus TaxID=332591 RepID=A0ABP6N5Z0_9ACTN
MRKNLRRISSAFIAAVAAAGLTLGAGCGSDESSGPAPKSESTTEETPQKKQEPEGKSERADLVRFKLDDRSQGGFTNIWVVWTIKNSSSDKSNYTWDWEAVNVSGTRVENGSQLETDVQPGQTATGEYPTTLKSAQDIKLNITSFDRTASY